MKTFEVIILSLIDCNSTNFRLDILEEFSSFLISEINQENKKKMAILRFSYKNFDIDSDSVIISTLANQNRKLEGATMSRKTYCRKVCLFTIAIICTT